MSLPLRKHRKVVRSITLEIDGEPVTLDIVKPTVGDKVRYFEDAQKAGEMDAEGKPANGTLQLRAAARILTFIVFLAGKPVFARGDVDAVLDAFEMEQLTQLANEAMPVFTGEKDAETLGNS